jgi:voltage-gated potassium channel
MLRYRRPTDALYFSISTLATVGFGDVHAAGQLARGAVAVQIVFNLVFVGTVAAMISGLMRHRATKRITGPPAAGDHGSTDAKD